MSGMIFQFDVNQTVLLTSTRLLSAFPYLQNEQSATDQRSTSGAKKACFI